MTQPSNEHLWSYKTARLSGILVLVGLIFSTTWPTLSGLYLGTLVPVDDLKAKEEELKTAKEELEKLKLAMATRSTALPRTDIIEGVPDEFVSENRKDLMPNKSFADNSNSSKLRAMSDSMTLRLGDNVYFAPGDFDIAYVSKIGSSGKVSRARYDLVVNGRHTSFEVGQTHSFVSAYSDNCTIRLLRDVKGTLSLQGDCT